MKTTVIRWGVLWRGNETHFMFNNCEPILFRTRKEARDHIFMKWHYIKSRPDLRAAPHNWRMPKAVRVTVTLKPVRGKP